MTPIKHFMFAFEQQYFLPKVLKKFPFLPVLNPTYQRSLEWIGTDLKTKVGGIVMFSYVYRC